MKLVRNSLLAVACLCLLPLTARAHHNGDPIGQLLEEAAQLNAIVQQSYLSPNVQDAVEHFVGDISLIEDCEMNPAPVPGFQGYPAQSCRGEVQHVLGAWNRVQRYLYDTTYDFPQVYQQYRNTQFALRNAINYMNR
jgi:hypothetical protein